jgi:hypothetical protein
MIPEDSQRIITSVVAEALNSSVVEPVSKDRALRVVGSLSLAHDKHESEQQAVCYFDIPLDWQQIMPRVQCLETWTTRNIDWHVYSDGSLCWVLDEEWTDVCEKSFKSLEERKAIKFCAEWMLHNVRWLLYRHFIAPGLGIVEWPVEWGGWRHGKKGREDYRLSKRFGR